MKKNISDILVDESSRHSRDISNIEKEILRMERELEGKKDRLNALREARDSIEITLTAMDTEEFSTIKRGFVEAQERKLARAERQAKEKS